MAPAAWANGLDREKKVTGAAYGRVSADFSVDQQDTSPIIQIAGSPSGRWEESEDGIWGDFGLARRSL